MITFIDMPGPLILKTHSPRLPASPRGGPFDLDDGVAYGRWRDAKLAGYTEVSADLIVQVHDPAALTPAERDAILDRCRKANMAIYASSRTDGKDAIRDLGRQLGLSRLDANLCADEDDITSLRVISEGRHQGYIPYTDRPLSWHTDGYYNPLDRQVRAWVLHCASDAASGGENGLLDHEIAYILLRDRDPALVAALMAPDAMTIPPNTEEGTEVRGAQSGPVFSVDSETGTLHMRYSARKRNIIWKQDPATIAAVRFLEDTLTGTCPYILHHRLAPGEGVISNNVLHNRTGFKDDPVRRRLIYRARYYDRIAGTAMQDTLGGGR